MLKYPVNLDDEFGEYMVTLPNGKKVSTWEFYRGEAGQNYSYCYKKGFKLHIKEIKDKNGKTLLHKPVCVKGDKEKSLVRFIYENGDYSSLYTLAPPPEDTIYPPSDPVEEPPSSQLSSSIVLDYRSVTGSLDAVIDQGSNGICYAIAAATTAGGAYFKNTSNYGGFSPYPIVNCGHDCLGQNALGQYYVPVNGIYGILSGYEEKALEMLINQGTVKGAEVFSTLCPCNNSFGSNTMRYIFNSYFPISPLNIENALGNYGPLFAVIKYESGSSFESYHLEPGQITVLANNVTCNSTNVISHCVVIVGYGIDIHNETYWIIRNSWGLGWGDNGYGYIKASSFASTCKVYALSYLAPAIQDNSSSSTWSFSLINTPPFPSSAFSWTAINPSAFIGTTNGSGTTANLTLANPTGSFTAGIVYNISSGCTPVWSISKEKSIANNSTLLIGATSVDFSEERKSSLLLNINPGFNPSMVASLTKWQLVNEIDGKACPFKILERTTGESSNSGSSVEIQAFSTGSGTLWVSLYNYSGFIGGYAVPIVSF